MQSLKPCLLPFLVAGLTACGGGGGGDNKPTPTSTAPVVSSTSVAPSSSATSSIAAENNEKTLAATPYANYSVAEIQNCGIGIGAQAKTFAIFPDYNAGMQNQSLTSLSISGWNHTTNGEAKDKWGTLKQPTTTYNFNTNAKANDTCNNVDTINMVLVKKIADWDHQHANGFERNIVAHGYKFGDIENIIVDLKVNSAKTSIPSIESLKTTYADYVDASAIGDLDEGKVNIDLTLFDGINLFGKINLQLDQATQADKWVRVTIPMNKVYLYQQINYDPRTTKTPAEMSNVVIQRITVVGETKNGSVLRGPIGNKWTTAVPETFKEMDISFKKIEFQLNK